MGSKLTEFQKDALKEMAGIGAGRASDSLSKLVKKPVNLTLSSIDLVSVEKIPRLISGPKRLVVGVFTKVKGDVSGVEFVVLLKKDALALTDLLLERKKPAEKLSKEDEMVLEEIGNILTGSYLSAVSDLFEINTLYEKPKIISTFGETIIDFILLGIGKTAKNALLLKTHFSVKKEKIEGDLILLIALKSANQLLTVIDKKIK